MPGKQLLDWRDSKRNLSPIIFSPHILPVLVLGSMHVLVLFFFPASHDFEHAVQPSQYVQWPLAGHGIALHALPSRSRPPQMAALSSPSSFLAVPWQARVRRAVPPPHMCEQRDHSPHSVRRPRPLLLPSIGGLRVRDHINQEP